MTKLKINITNQKAISLARKKGAYLATNNTKDDRIIFFNSNNQEFVTVLNTSYDGTFHMQEKQGVHMYTNLKKIKKVTIEVELE